MRPIQLTMNAFGPYRGKVDLDFTLFGASSIFLVTGPTGAGKTTIFDALTYALFNHASGEIRELDMLKSQFATDEDLCYVELSFEVGTTKYRVKRSPQQIGPGTRVKTRELSAEVEFFKEEQLIETGRNANEAIKDLLGLSFEQFRQIVMLPQGEFRRLLQSNSSEKEEIFRNIFGTEQIQYFQEHLKEKRKELRDEFKTYQTRLDQSLSTIVVEENSNLTEAIKKADYEEVLTILKVLISKGNKELTAKRQKIAQLSQTEKENDVYIQLLKEKEALEQAKKKLDATEAEINEQQKALRLHEQATETSKEYEAHKKLEEALKQTKTDLTKNKETNETIKAEIKILSEKNKAAKEAEQGLDKIRKEVTGLEVEREKFADLEKKTKDLKAKNDDLKLRHKEIKVFETATEKFVEQIKSLTADIQKIQVWRDDLNTEQKKQETLKETHTELKSKKEALAKIIKHQQELSELLKENETCSKQYDKSQQEYEQARKHYFGNLAGVLVGELVDDKACPVCGSLHHPNPTKTSADFITEEELDAYEQARDKDKADHTEIAAVMKQKAVQIKEQEELLTEIDGEYIEVLASVEKQETILIDELTEGTKAIKTLEEKLSQENTLRAALEEAQAESQQNQLNLAQAKSKEANVLEKIKELKATIKDIHQALRFDSPQAVQAIIEQRQNKIQEVQKEAEDIRDTYTEKLSKQAQIETTISMLEGQLKKDQTAKNKQKAILDDLMNQYEFVDGFSEYLLENSEEKAYKEAIKYYDDEILYNTRQLKQTNKRLDAQDDRRPIAEVEANLLDIRDQKEKCENERDALIAQNSKHTSSFDEIEANYSESQKIHKPLAIYEELAEIANGSTKTNYISFERYVLSIYFEEVLFAANQRFETMANGRYEMVRRENRTKGAGPEGLEIDVFDRYAGAKRSVKTLSGGETFKASLALALGLSDVIQNQQGGVHVDTLFIDEGFGTLDADSLEMAIETLMDLQATGRLIGVISHVDELKDRIPARIVVENKQEGSQARIEVE